MGKEAVVHHSPYPMLPTPDGVKDCIQSLKRGFEDKGHVLFTVAPKKGRREDNQADFYAGTPLRKVSHGGTAYRPSVIFSTEEVKKFLHETNPLAMVLHEPVVPDSGRRLIKLASDEMGEKFPLIGQFHARSDRLGKVLQIVVFLHRHGMLKWYTDDIFKNLTGRIAVSNATARFWDGYFPGDYEVIHNGMSLDEFNQNVPVIEEWLTDNKPVVFITGRDDPRKGKIDALRAYANLRATGVNAVLKVSGLEKPNSELRKEVKRKNIPDVEFLGNLSAEMYRRAMRTAAVYLGCSRGNEGTNRTILDAQAVGTLVVATDIPGHDEAYGGFLPMPKPRDVEGIENATFQRLHLSPEIKQQELARARKHVEKEFNIKHIVLQHLDYYEKCRSKASQPDKRMTISSPHGVIFSSRG